MIAGRSGIRRLTNFDITDIPVGIGGDLVGFDPAEYLPKQLIRRTDRTVHMALAATLQALREAKLEITPEMAPRVAVVIGTAGGPTRTVIDAGEALGSRGFYGISPYFFATSSVDSTAGEVSMHIGAQGPSHCMTTACATGATCLGEAMQLIRSGRADVVVAGGVDHTLTRLDLAAAARATALSRRQDPPEAASRPFDRGRDGFVMSAGAGVLVLESAAHAARRGAHAHAELAGYGATTDAFHLTAPQPTGVMVERAMRMALEEAGVRPEDIGYVNAHGTGTKLNDSIEIGVIRRVLGEHATRIPISSTKSMTGHMLGAAGAVELLAAVEAMNTGLVPPTINCDDPEDPELNFVPWRAQRHDVEVAMSNSFGFGGHNAVLVVRRLR
jgi:3-oxoacyl-[acyl-carrier-protein] synthase II